MVLFFMVMFLSPPHPPQGGINKKQASFEYLDKKKGYIPFYRKYSPLFNNYF